MDADTRTLIERTRQRREILNQRFAGMPEAAPRKRRTPVLESDGTEKVIPSNPDPDDVSSTDSPKRPCLRDVELNVKQDTPAIRGVQSRIKDLKHEDQNEDENQHDAPTPKPRKSVSSPPAERMSPTKMSPAKTPGLPSSSRKSRFAALAQNINDWEDDMTHHVIHKEEEKKPRWQPPTKSTASPAKSTMASPAKVAAPSPAKMGTASPAKMTAFSPAKTAIGSPKKAVSKAPPTKEAAKAVSSPSKPGPGVAASNTLEKLASTKKHYAPPAPASPALARNSPLRSSKVEWNRSPKPFSPAYMDNAVSPSKSVIKPVTPVLASPKSSHKDTAKFVAHKQVVLKTSADREVTPATSKRAVPHTPAGMPVNAPGLYETPPESNKATDEPTHKPVSQRRAAWANRLDSPEPSRQPISAKLANFEDKISQNTPRLGMASSAHVPRTPRQVLPSLSASTPAASATPRPAAKTGDPIELPVSQRMSQMQEKLAKKHQDEPTAYSVGARMSAWEDMTSANMVSDVKKVNPGQSTPYSAKSRPVQAATPKSSSAPANVTAGIPQPPPPPPVVAKGITPSKSFRESIEEKAAEVSRRTGMQYTNKSPVKPISHSPNKVSAATRSVQQHLVGQVQESSTTCSQMAAQNRAARAAELAALSNRWKNGILREDNAEGDAEVPIQVESKPQAERSVSPSKGETRSRSPSNSRRQVGREKARADFNNKLAEIGLDGAGAIEPSPSIKAPTTPQKKAETSQTSSIYNLIKKREELTPSKQEEKKVKFNDSFDDSDDESDRKIPKSAAKRAAQQASEEVTFKKPTVESVKESVESHDDSAAESVLSERNSMDVTDDDISLKGFVSEAVRRESIMVGRGRASSSSLDSYAESDRGTVDSEEGLKSTAGSSSRKGGYQPDDESMDEEDEDDNKRQAVNDLLDDAFDDTADEYDPDMDVNNVVLRRQAPQREVESVNYEADMDINNVIMRRKPAQSTACSESMESTDDDDNRPYSLQAYRKSAAIQQHHLAPVVRSSKYVGKPVVEEDIAMPAASAQPRVDDRRAVQERIKELKELVQQEQSVIMQTSNALNKCCVGNPMFAGSSEQVECNRLLLLACQKRQCYMTEIERLKATAQLSPDGPGPRGSITISDIRLPLKKDFVTKIGTSHDTSTHYFILLIRNGPQLICSQMLSTHDPMVRGSLDFPNLIKINGISGNFKLTLDIYGMNVSREVVSKDKKRKTPKKQKGLPLESPGGPTAVRTTSFSHVTSIELTKKSLDKSSFHLERLSYLSPLYGQIYLRLKCLMETNVEERAFLTMFDDVSGFGAWHRRWCVLSGNKLCIWKYPDDETRKDPMAVIDLKRCVSDKVGLVSRDICARPNTFEMVTVRQPLKGEHDTLVTRTYNSTTSVRHLMSADSKEERIVWCNKINRTLANLRTWNADALKPMRPAAPSSSSRR